ncbi:MAG: C4-dicarboxylate TRAP transporter substrate-binding protein [Hyphomicrobiales bacterium]|nr:C4-dicarboxylate TRAP transporter substrate-binding protein [Hyphomicrobiales bacterium]
MKQPLLKAAALAFAGVFAANVAQADPVKIVYANYVNIKHPTNLSLEKFFKKIEADSGGSIDIEWHFASSLLGAKEIPAGVRDGLADSGYMIGVFVPSEMPVDNYIGDFTMINDDPLAVTGAVNELIIHHCPQCKKEYEEDFKVKYLGSYSLTPYLLQCKDERKSLDDFKGVKVRGFSSIAEMVKAMGAVPVGVTTSEMYEALQRGVLDCTAHMLTSQRSFSLGEVAKYVILDSLGGFMGGSMLNLRLDKWNELSPEQRAVIVKNLPDVVAETTYNYLRLDGEVQKEMEAKGNKFYHADPAMVKMINDFRADYIENKVVAKGRERGVENPEEIKKNILKLKAEWKKLLDERGRDEATFSKLLWERIYSKM